MSPVKDDEVLRTERLLLRRWRPGDLEIVAPHYADSDVMVFIPGGAWTLETTEKVIARMTERELLNGFGYYPLVRRDDDTPAALRTRLRDYHEKTTPVLELFERKEVVVTVDGTRMPDEV